MEKILLLLLLVSQSAFSIHIEGKWRIGSIPGLKDDSQFVLYPIEGEGLSGNNINFNENKFTVQYHAPCLNDCFPSVWGRYEMTDDNHVRLFLEKVSFWGMCGSRRKDYEPKDLGLFYISAEGESIKLIKSDGNIRQDLLNAKYSKLIETDFGKERYGPNHYTCRIKAGYTLEQTIRARLDKAGIAESYKLVYQRPWYGGKSVAIVENDGHIIYLTVEN